VSNILRSHRGFVSPVKCEHCVRFTWIAAGTKVYLLIRSLCVHGSSVTSGGEGIAAQRCRPCRSLHHSSSTLCTGSCNCCPPCNMAQCRLHPNIYTDGGLSRCVLGLCFTALASSTCLNLGCVMAAFAPSYPPRCMWRWASCMPPVSCSLCDRPCPHRHPVR
jgi:hypothetical protein